MNKLAVAAATAMTVLAIFVIGNNLHAQTAFVGGFNNDLEPVQAAPDSTIVGLTAEQAGLSLVPPDQVPRFGTFWIGCDGGRIFAPLPSTPDTNFPVYDITGEGQQFLVDCAGTAVLSTPTTGRLATSTGRLAALTATAGAVENLINMIQGIAANQQMQAMSRSMGMAAGLPSFDDAGGSDGGGTPNDYIIPIPDYGTNLWIAQVMVGGGYLTGIASNTLAGVQYEIQSTTNLTLPNWSSEGFIFGSEMTNWTPLSVAQNNRTNLFLRLKSWADSNDSGIPDWWWLQFFGQITNVDPNFSAAGDGYSNLQKFQMGLNPVTYYNPNAPGGFFGCLDATGTNVLIEWSPSPGPVSYYVIQRGILNTNLGTYTFSQAGLVSSNATFFKDVGALANANGLNNIYNLQAAYVGGGLTDTDIWYASWYADYGGYGPPYGPPMLGEVYAYARPAGTNVLISWTLASGQATNYVIELGIYDTNSGDYNFSQIAAVNTNTTLFTNVGAIHVANDWNSVYEVAAGYPGGGLSQPASSSIYTNPPPPTGFSATVDATGTNVLISWTPPQGVTVTNYVLERGIYDPNTGNYTYSQIGTVGAGTTSFEDPGAITSDNSYYNAYRITAVYPGGGVSGLNYSYLAGPPSASPFTDNIHITACLIRNGAGHWQLMFSGLSTNVQAIALNWYSYDYFYDDGSIADPELGYPFTVETDIPVGSLTNGVYVIPDFLTTNALANGIYNNLGAGQSLELAPVVVVQPIAANGIYGNPIMLPLPDDEPAFADGRQCLKQNLLFELRAATMSQPFGSLFDPGNDVGSIPADTNYVESSFFHWSLMPKGYGDTNLFAPEFIKMDDLWPFEANYELHQRVTIQVTPGHLHLSGKQISQPFLRPLFLASVIPIGFCKTWAIRRTWGSAPTPTIYRWPAASKISLGWSLERPW